MSYSRKKGATDKARKAALEARRNKEQEPKDQLTEEERDYIHANGGVDDRPPLAKYYHLVDKGDYWA